MISYGDKQGILYKGDYRPAELYGYVDKYAVKFNQLVDFSKWNVGGYGGSVTPTGYDNGILHLTTKDFSTFYAGERIFNPQNHLFYVSATVRIPDTFTGTYAGISITTGSGVIAETIDGTSTFDINNYGIQKRSIIRKVISASQNFVYPYFQTNAPNGVDIEFFHFKCFDLTEMFGEGFEPTNVSDIERWFPEESYAPINNEIQIAPPNIRTPFITKGWGKISGFINESHNGLDVDFEETYNDHADIIINGSHYQETYTGRNLLNITDCAEDFTPIVHQNNLRSKIEFTKNGIKYIALVDNSVNVDTAFVVTTKQYVKLKGDTYYTIVMKYVRHNNTQSQLQIGDTANYRTFITNKDGVRTAFSIPPYFGGSNHEHSEGIAVGIFMPPADGEYTISLGVDTPNGYIYDPSISESYLFMYDFMLVEGRYTTASTAPSYEPYVGGVGLPNPSHPIDIIGFTPNINIHGKNLLSKNSQSMHIFSSGGTYTIIDDHIKTKGRYTFSAKYVTPDDSLMSARFGIRFYDEDGNIYSDDAHKPSGYLWNMYYKAYWKDIGSMTPNIPFTGIVTFEVPDDIYAWSIFIGASSNRASDGIFEVYDIQVEKGTVATRFEKYKNQKYTNDTLTLYGDGITNDILEPCVKVDGEWKCRVTRNWLIYDCYYHTGEMIMWSIKVNEEEHKAPFYFSNAIILGTYGNPTFYDDGAKCTIGWDFKSVYSYTDIGNYYAASSSSPPYVAVTLPCITTNEAKEYINNLGPNKMMFLVKLREPVVELYDPIPINTFPNYTHISLINDNPNLSPTMDVSAKVVDHSIAELTSLLDSQYLDALEDL